MKRAIDSELQRIARVIESIDESLDDGGLPPSVRIREAQQNMRSLIGDIDELCHRLVVDKKGYKL